MAQPAPASVAHLVAVALLLAGCTAASAPTAIPPATAAQPAPPTLAVSPTPRPPTAEPSATPTERPLAEPTASPTPPYLAPVDGWTGTVFKRCQGMLFDDYFQRDDGERYGIWGAEPDVEAQVQAAPCQPGTVIRVWGTLWTGIPDVEGRQISAERLEVVSTPPPPAPDQGPAEEPVEGWHGRIFPLWRCDDLDDYFERDDGMRFGIDAPRRDDQPNGGPVLEGLDMAKCTDHPVRIWGTLYRGVDDYRGTQIVVNRIEME